MANWNNLKTFIHANYKVAADDGGLVNLVFNTDDGRSQMVLVSHSVTGAGIEFATIASPVAEVGQVDLAEVLSALGDYVVGGATIFDKWVMVRHAVPLDSIDADDFVAPLHLVVLAADALEKQFTGGDKF